MGHTLKGSIVGSVMTNESLVAVDIARRADLFGNPADRHLLAIEFAVTIFEIMLPARLRCEDRVCERVTLT